MIGIRADANKQIALGHVMRCMTIADEIEKLGEKVVFFVADNEAEDMITQRGFEVVILGTDWNNPMEEIEKLSKEVNSRDITTMLFDSYSFNAEYYNRFSKECNNVKIACMDDLGEEVYPADYVINYNPYYDLFDYENKYGENTRCLLGMTYAPLRPQFADMPERFLQNFPLKIFVASGGSDNSGIIPALVREISSRRSLAEFDFHVILGKFLDCRDEIDRIIWCSNNIFKHDKVDEMAKLMSNCDIAISASGTMLTELCSLKVPTINYVLADNQKYTAEYFDKNGFMISGGDIREDLDASVKLILDELEELAEDKQQRRELKRKLDGLCDGHGAERIAKVLCEAE